MVLFSLTTLFVYLTILLEREVWCFFHLILVQRNLLKDASKSKLNPFLRIVIYLVSLHPITKCHSKSSIMAINTSWVWCMLQICSCICGPNSFMQQSVILIAIWWPCMISEEQNYHSLSVSSRVLYGERNYCENLRNEYSGYEKKDMDVWITNKEKKYYSIKGGFYEFCLATNKWHTRFNSPS